MKFIRHIVCVCLLCTLGCSQYEFDINQDNAEWAVPLVYGTIKVRSLIGEATTESVVTVLPDGILNLQYTGQVLQKTKKEIFQPIPGLIPIPMFDTSTLVTLPVVNNVVIKRAILTNGKYSFTYGHSRPEPVKLQLWVPEMKIKNQILSHSIDIPFGGTTPINGSSPQYSLEDIEMIPVNNKIGLHYKASNASGQEFKMNNLFFSYDQIDFKYIQGLIGQNLYDLKKDSITIDFYDSFVQGSLYVDDPKVTLTVTSSFGFPTKAIVNLFDIQTKSGQYLKFTSKLIDDGLFFNFPKLIESGQSKTTTFVFTKDNSNVRDVFNAQAQRIIYDIDALSNPELVQDSTSFILEESKFTINVTVDLPLKGNARDYPATQVFDVDASKLADLREGFLLVETNNSVALAADIQLHLMTESGQLIDSVFTTPPIAFKAASTNAAGVSTASSFNSLKIPIPASKIQNWSQTRKIRATARFNTAENRNVVQIADKDLFNIRVGFIGKLK